MKQKLPAGLIDSNIEVFSDEKENLFAIHGGITIAFFDLPEEIIAAFKEEMLNNTQAIVSLNKHGLKTIDEMLHQYVWCNYGGFDNTPDFITESNDLTKEFWLCGKRKDCPFVHKVCGQLIAPNEEYLTKQEIRIIQLIAAGLFDAELAETLFIAQGTIIAHKANIFRKLQVNSKNEVTIFAYQNNLAK